MRKNDIRNMSKRKVLLTSAFAFVFGAIFLGIGIFGIFILPSLHVDYVEVEGTVIDYDVQVSGDTKLYALIVEFTYNGELYTVTGDTYSAAPIPIGTTQIFTIKVNNPAYSIFATADKSFLLVFTGLGGLFVIGSIGNVIIRFRYKGDDVVVDDTSGIDSNQQF